MGIFAPHGAAIIDDLKPSDSSVVLDVAAGAIDACGMIVAGVK